jgi:hypothetical protein
MSNEALKAWLDAMPIDDVRSRIARLEAKLSDLRVLERMYSERRDAPGATPQQPEGEQPSPPQDWGHQPT